MAEKAASLLLCILVISVLFFPLTAQGASNLPPEDTSASRKSIYYKGGGDKDRTKVGGSSTYSRNAPSKTVSPSPKGGGGSDRAKVAMSPSYSPTARSKTGPSPPSTQKLGKRANGGAK